jgi:hypothetical protein
MTELLHYNDNTRKNPLNCGYCSNRKGKCLGLFCSYYKKNDYCNCKYYEPLIKIVKG